MKKESLIFLKELQNEINTQPTDIQANPRFWTVAQYVYGPCWEDNADTHWYIDTDGNHWETLDKLLEFLIDNEYIDTKLGYEDANDLDGIYDVYLCPVKRVHKIIQNTMFLTKREAQEHIKRNHYHYNKSVHTYAMTAWRSPQVERLIDILLNEEFDNER